MISKGQGRKLVGMGFLITMAFAGLGYRLVDLQVVQHEKWREESEETTRRTYLRAAKRGDIRDVRGNLLAGSVFVKTVCADPLIIGEKRAEVARVLAPLLEMPEADLVYRLQPRLRWDDGQWKTNRFVVLKHKVPVETWELIQAAIKELPSGVNLRSLPRREREAYGSIREAGIQTAPVDDQIRVYPNHSLAAHVLGFVGRGETDSPKGRIQQLEGKDGIELTLDGPLKGAVGWKNTEVVRKRELVGFRDQNVEAHPGRNVMLSLDASVQHIAETELAAAVEKHAPISASAVVVRPRTGEILAMATWPTFDPNDLTGTSAPQRRNRVVTDLAEPGSTFKIVVIAGALNDGTVSLDDRFDCENGLFVFAGKLLHDHVRYGELTVEEIITHSSNIGAAKVGIKMGQERLYQYIRDFGFGTRTGISLVGEGSGLINPVNRWTKLSISRIPMGHEVAATPLQMVMAMCAVANNGWLMRPMLVDRLEDESGQVLFRNSPQPVRQVVSERAARQMVNALKTVVSTNGTGRKAMLEHYTAAGKTGTAQKIVDGTYRRDKHFSSFIGFFPADAPELCVGVFLDEPKNGYYGGEAAAPIFRNIAERAGKYLAIPPDLSPASAVAGEPTPGVGKFKPERIARGVD